MKKSETTPIPPVRRLLKRQGGSLSLNGKHGSSTPADYEESTYIIGMDDENRRDLYRLPKATRRKKCPSFSNGQEKIGVSPIRGILMITKRPIVI